MYGRRMGMWDVELHGDIHGASTAVQLAWRQLVVSQVPSCVVVLVVLVVVSSVS